MANHEAVVKRKEQELKYEREYRSQLQSEKIELENEISQLRAEVGFILRGQDNCSIYTVIVASMLIMVSAVVLAQGTGHKSDNCTRRS